MRGLLAAGVAFAIGLAGAGCGGDDNGGREPRTEAAVRCTPAPSGGGPLRMRPRWKPGDEREVRIEKTREDKELPQPLRATSSARLRVLDAGPRGSTLRWSTDHAVLALGGRLPPPALKRLEEEAGRLELEYATDRDGAFAEVENVPEVRDNIRRAVDLLETLLEGNQQSLTALQRSRKLVESEQFIQTTAGEEARLLHALYGAELKPGERQSGPDEIPNPFGGEAIPSTFELRLVSARDPNGCANVDLTTKPDPAEMRRIIAESLAGVSGGEVDPAQLGDMEMRNEVKFTYDAGTGWITRIEATKSITATGRSRVDRTVITSR